MTVYDVGDGSWWGLTGQQREALRAWLDRHGIDTADTIRFELLVIDAPLIRATQYEPGPDSGRRILPDGEALATRTVDVLQHTPPPVQPWSPNP